MTAPFKSIVLLTLCLFLNDRGWGAAATGGDLPPIPPDLHFEFKPIPEDQNAIIKWRQAAAAMVPLTTNELRSLITCRTPGAHEPTDDELASLRSWLARNREALNTFNQSLD